MPLVSAAWKAEQPETMSAGWPWPAHRAVADHLARLARRGRRATAPAVPARRATGRRRMPLRLTMTPAEASAMERAAGSVPAARDRPGALTRSGETCPGPVPGPRTLTAALMPTLMLRRSARGAGKAG